MDKNKINILVILGNLGMGGIERHLSYLFQHADKRIFQFHIIVLRKFGQLVEIAEHQGIPIYELNIEKTYTLKALLKAIKLRKVLIKENIHIINAYQFKESLFSFYLKLLCWKTILITGRRDFRTQEKKSITLAYRFINSLTKYIVAVSDKIKEITISKESLSPNKILTIHNGVDTKKFSISPEMRKRIRQEFNIPEQGIVIGTVANLKPTKGYSILVKAFNAISRRNNNVRLMITGKWLQGSSELKKEVEELLDKNNLTDKVIFTGPRDDIPVILNAHDLFVLPSYDEGFSNAILEAMSSGKPVITTDVGGNCEVIQNMQDGIIITPGNIDELTKSMIYLIDNPQKASEMGRLARKKILNKFSVETMVSNWSDLYKKLFEDKQSLSN